MSKLPIEAVDQMAQAHKEYIEKIIDVADKNGVDRNELIRMACSTTYLMSKSDHSKYYEHEEKGEPVNG